MCLGGLEGISPVHLGKQQRIMNPLYRIMVTNMTLPFRFSEAFWGAWIQVMFPTNK